MWLFVRKKFRTLFVIVIIHVSDFELIIQNSGRDSLVSERKVHIW